MQHYEFPSGYHQDFGAERLRIPECFFDPAFSVELTELSHRQAIACPAHPGGPAEVSGGGGPLCVPLGWQPLPGMVATAASMCDADLRATLYANVLLVGGGSLVAGLGDRLQHELATRLQAGSLRLKLIAAPNALERRCAAWIGGSILASLGLSPFNTPLQHPLQHFPPYSLRLAFY